MMTREAVLNLVVAAIIVISSPITYAMPELKHAESVKTVAAANNLLSQKLYQTLNSEDPPNVVLSGFGVAAVLSMAALGAKSETKNEMVSVLNLPDDSTIMEAYEDITDALEPVENCTIEIANSIFSQSGLPLEKDFVEAAKIRFKATPVSLDFGEPEKSRGSINSWAEEKTHGKIKDLLPEGCVNTDTKLVLVNALYFKGDWATKFDPKNTNKMDFHVSKDVTVQTDMMHSSSKQEFRYGNMKDLGASIIELPYTGDSTSMYIILPNEKFDLKSVESKLPEFDFSSFENRGRVKVQLIMPKFNIASTHDMTESLKKLGLAKMFDASSADFSGISKEPLYASSVHQKAVIEVNEEGTEAAAATGMVMMMRSMPLPPVSFTVDHPFLFLIKDKHTKSVLFLGRITNPSV